MAFTNRTASAVLVAGALLATPSAPAQADDGDVALRVRHYEAVERELLAADTAHLSPEQRAARVRAITELRMYRERADFGRNADFPGERRPYFVDGDGRRCAVAHLLHRWGQDDLVAAVARSSNDAYVSDLAGSAELRTWLQEVGLSLQEAARIQAPTIPPSTDDVSEQPVDLDDLSNPEAEPVGRPGGVAPSGGDVPSATGGTGVTRRTPRTGSRGVGADSWWMWWEFNKLSYITANPLQVETSVTGGDGARPPAGAALDGRRRAAMDLVRKDLVNPDARVRAAASIAFGRIGGAAAEGALLTLLGDSQQQVRESTILALGASGSSGAVDALLEIAAGGSLTKQGGDLSPHARGTALLALAMARRTGAADDTAAAVATIVAAAKKRDAEQVRAGGLLFQRLSPADVLASKATSLAADRNAAPQVRALAIEEMTGESAGRLATLQKTLAGRELELRRSAAIALGVTVHELVLPRLQTAFELEREPLTRGFLLLAIGRQGGGAARTFLATQMREGPAMLRPWAALALGVLAREDDDSTARIILGNATLPDADLGALYIARGLAGDRDAVPDLAQALTSDAAPGKRGHAASALGLIGGETARFALLSAHSTEKSAGVRAAISVSLGSLGAGEDADVLLASMADAGDPTLRGTLAVALGLHGSQDTLNGVERLLASKETTTSARATALQALGILLDRRGPMVLPEVSSGTNFAALPDWVLAALQTGL